MCTRCNRYAYSKKWTIRKRKSRRPRPTKMLDHRKILEFRERSAITRLVLCMRIPQLHCQDRPRCRCYPKIGRCYPDRSRERRDVLRSRPSTIRCNPRPKVFTNDRASPFRGTPDTIRARNSLAIDERWARGNAKRSRIDTAHSPLRDTEMMTEGSRGTQPRRLARADVSESARK